MNAGRRRLMVIAAVAALPLALTAYLLIPWQGEPGLRSERRVAWARENAESIREEALQVVDPGDQLSRLRMIEAARGFVYEYSTHNSDRGPFAKVEPYAVWRMLQTLRKGAPKLRVTCGPRAYALKWLLDGAGVKSRRVQVYSGTRDFIRGHRFLDVLNPDTGCWEVQDPSFDVSYRRIDAGQSVCTEDLVFGDLGKVEPFSTKTGGWSACRVDFLRKEYFHALLYEEQRPHLILVNATRLNEKKLFRGNGERTFEKWARDLYGKGGRRKVIVLHRRTGGKESAAD